MKIKLRSNSHSVFAIHLHLVFVTKYRRKVITQDILTRLSEVFTHVCEKQKCILTEFNGEPDHVHLLVDLAPDTLISQLVASLKSASSRIVRKEFALQVSKYYWKPVFWSDSYCAISTGGAPLEVLKQYIQNQHAPEV